MTPTFLNPSTVRLAKPGLQPSGINATGPLVQNVMIQPRTSARFAVSFFDFSGLNYSK